YREAVGTIRIGRNAIVIDLHLIGNGIDVDRVDVRRRDRDAVELAVRNDDGGGAGDGVLNAVGDVVVRTVGRDADLHRPLIRGVARLKRRGCHATHGVRGNRSADEVASDGRGRQLGIADIADDFVLHVV